MKRKDGEWVQVKPTPDAYIVNVGDIILVTFSFYDIILVTFSNLQTNFSKCK